MLTVSSGGDIQDRTRLLFSESTWLTGWFLPEHVQGVSAFSCEGDSLFSVVTFIGLALLNRWEGELVVVEVVHVDVALVLAEITRAFDPGHSHVQFLDRLVMPSQGAISLRAVGKSWCQE